MNNTDSASSISNNILIYNLKGEQVAIFQTDCRIASIIGNIKDNTIYGIYPENDPVIVEFR